jgi:nitrous oxidase accessory protein NosD
VKALLAGLMCGLLLASSVASAQPAIKQQPVQFKKGESGATIKGSLKGDQIIDYTLRASAGPVMSVNYTLSFRTH